LAGGARRQPVLGRNLFLHADAGASPGWGRRGGGADGARAVLSGDALPLLAGGPARSGRGAALRMSPSEIGGSPALELRGVRKTFRQGAVEIAVLNGVDLSLQSGEIVALVGP